VPHVRAYLSDALSSHHTEIEELREMTMIGWEYFTQAEVQYRTDRAHKSWGTARRKARGGRSTRRWLGARRGADDVR
jgi:hypothetical protein